MTSPKTITTPAYPWYAKDWLTSEDRLTMSGSERGIYRDLLDHQWVHGSIPKSLDEVIVILNLSRVEVTAAWPRVRKKFQILSENRSRLVNIRLETVRHSRLDYIERAAEGGRKSGEVRRRSSGINELTKSTSTSETKSGSKHFEAAAGSAVEHSVSVSVSDKTPLPLIGSHHLDEHFVTLRETAERYGMQCSEEEWEQAYHFAWLKLQFTEQLEAIRGIEARIAAADESLVNALPKNYLADRKWKRRVRKPERNGREEAPMPKYVPSWEEPNV